MAVSRIQLLGALEQFALASFFHGWPNTNPPPATVVNFVKTTNDNLVEAMVDANCATWIAGNVAQVIQNWNTALQGIGLMTDLSPQNLSTTKAHNLNECSAWATGRENQIYQLNEFLADLLNWQQNYRGAYVVVKGLKLIRTFSKD